MLELDCRKVIWKRWELMASPLFTEIIIRKDVDSVALMGKKITGRIL